MKYILFLKQILKGDKMKNLITFLFFVFITTSMFAQHGNNKTALLLIDIQDYYFTGGKHELVNPEKAVKEAEKILKFFRTKGDEIIHVKHIAKSEGDIYTSVSPLNSEKVITKSEVSCFNGTDLLQYLKEKEIKNLVICGMTTQMCVEAAVRAGYDYGFKIILISDACATKDQIYDEKRIKAEDVHNSTLVALRYYAKIITSDEFLKGNNETR